MPTASKMDTIEFMNRHLVSTMGPRVPDKKRAEFLHTVLSEFHSGTCTQERKQEIATEVIREVFFLCVRNAGGRTSPMTSIDDILSLMISNVMQAIENYNPAVEAKFSSFLRGYLKNAISTAYRDTFLIRHPYRSRMETLKKIKALQKGETPEKLSRQEKVELFEEFVQSMTPDVTFFEDAEVEPSISNDSALPSNCSEPVDALEHMLSGEKLYLLGHILAHEHPLLSAKEKMVVKHRYGVFGHERLTLEDVAERFHSIGWKATKEWIFQLEKRALDKIRAHFQLYSLN